VQRRQRRRDAEQLEVVLLARPQRLAVAVAAIAGQTVVDGPVPVGQRRPVRGDPVLEDRRRPSVGQIHQGQPARARLVGVHHPFLAVHDLQRPAFRRQVRRRRQGIGIGRG
jgi:hypothetical protein